MQRTLAPGGRIAFSVPRLDRRPRLFDPVADQPPHHLTLWTKAAMAAALGRIGLTVEAIHARPLSCLDLATHANWRRARRSGRPSTIGAMPATAHPLRRLARRAISRSLNLVLAAASHCGLVRGHTLLAIARLP